MSYLLLLTGAMFVRGYAPTDTARFEVVSVNDIAPAPGGWVLVGDLGDSTGQLGGLVVKVDTVAQVQWARVRYPAAQAWDLSFTSVFVDQEANKIWAAGYMRVGDTLWPMLVRMDGAGQTEAQAFYRYPYKVQRVPVALLPKGDTLLLVGYDTYGFFALAVNPQDLSVFWAKWYGTGYTLYRTSGALVDRFGVTYVAGFTDDNISGDTLPFLVVLDSIGNIIAARGYYGDQGHKIYVNGIWRSPSIDFVYLVGAVRPGGLGEVWRPLFMVIDDAYDLVTQDTISASTSSSLRSVWGVGDTVVAVGRHEDLPFIVGFDPLSGDLIWAVYGAYAIGRDATLWKVISAPDSGWLAAGPYPFLGEFGFHLGKSVSSYENCLTSASLSTGSYQMGAFNLGLRPYGESPAPYIPNLGLESVEITWGDLCEFQGCAETQGEGPLRAWASGDEVFLRLGSEAKVKVRAYDPSGRLVFEEELLAPAGLQRIEVPGSGLRLVLVEAGSFRARLKVF